VYTIYTLNLVRPGREQQRSYYIVDTLQIYILITIIFVKILIINVFITELDGKLLIRNFHFKNRK